MTDLASAAGRMARATLGQGAATIWSAALGLVTTPYLIEHLGTSRYGMFALISVVSSYLSNLEFGFGHASIRFLAAAKASGDVDEQRAVFGNGLAVFASGAFAACALTIFGAAFIVQHFAHGPVSLHHTFITAIKLAGPIVGMSMLCSFTSACLQALGRFGYIIVAPWVFGTLLSLSAVTIVAVGGGLLTIIAAQLIIYALLLLTYCVVLLGASSVTAHPRFDRRTFTAMAKFSGWVMIAGIATQSIFQGPPAVLAAYRTTAEVALFAVPNTIFQQLTSLVGATGIGFFPFVSAASASGDLEPVRAIYAANLRLTILVLAPVVTFLAVFADPLLSFWIDPAFARGAATPLRFMAVSAVILGISAAPSDVARGFGRPIFVTTYAGVAAAAVLGLSFIAVPLLGPTGAALGLAAGLALVTLPFTFVVARVILQLHPAHLLRSLTGPLFAGLLAAAAYECGLVLSDTFAGAVVSGAIGTSLYAALVFKFFLDPRERAVLQSIVARVLRRPATSSAQTN